MTIIRDFVQVHNEELFYYTNRVFLKGFKIKENLIRINVKKTT